MFYTAIVFGLLSSFHCVGMCGPIVFALPVHNQSSIVKWGKLFLYHLGRLLGYASIGVLFGVFGRSLFLAGFQQSLAIYVGVFLLFGAFFYKNIGLKFEQFMNHKLGNALKVQFVYFIKKRNLFSFFMLGMLNGYLPCGMVYFALVGALAVQEWYLGAFYMFLFGVGTLPLMLVISALKVKSHFIPQKFTKKLIPVFIALVGVLFILRGAGLGIKYISPKPVSLQVQLDPAGCH